MSPNPALGPKPKRVLLVDDNELIRRLRATILGNLGHEVIEAASLEEARALWNPKRFHLIIVDLKQDAERALQFCEELKQRWPDQLVAFLTPHTTYVHPNSCPDEVIPKEDGPAQLVRQVQQMLAA